MGPMGLIVDPSQGLGDAFDAMQTDFPMDLDVPLDSQYNVPVSSQASLQDPQPIPQQRPVPQGETLNNAFASRQQSSMSGVGAGPLPTGFGATNNGSTTVTEFTKRRNWSHRVLEDLRDFLYVVTPDGRIIYASPSCKLLTGWEPAQLVGKFIASFIHNDDQAIFMREFNESIASGNPLRFYHRFTKPDGTFIILESQGHPHLSHESTTFTGPGGPGFCRGFFMMSRPYPTKNAALLDSFLEHKVENERLRKRIEELKREEQEEEETQERQFMSRPDGQSSVAPSDSQRTDGRTDEGTHVPQKYSTSMPPPAKPDISNLALTRQNLLDAQAASKPDSINDKMARYEGATHIDSIEMMTGLRYGAGERSQGISTGDTSPALIRGDAGIAISVDKDNRTTGDKKKKLKVADEYVCTDCGTLDSPEWRKGPNGPKTLCNACGLRWAKKEKKRQSVVGNGNGNAPPSMPMQTSTNSS